MTLSLEELEKLYLEEAVQAIQMAVDGNVAVSGWPEKFAVDCGFNPESEASND